MSTHPSESVMKCVAYEVQETGILRNAIFTTCSKIYNLELNFMTPCFPKNKNRFELAFR
mgnify:CR=1 FL=1